VFLIDKNIEYHNNALSVGRRTAAPLKSAVRQGKIAMKIKEISLMNSIVFALILIGCASSHVLVGKARPPINSVDVKMYTTPPKQYEEIAMISASSKNSFAIGDQGKMNVVIDRLKKEAAKLGANGILLKGLGDQSTAFVGTGYTNPSGFGTFFGGTALHKSANGLAIFVMEE